MYSFRIYSTCSTYLFRSVRPKGVLVRESSQFLGVKIYKSEALRTKNPMLLGFNPRHIYIVQVLKIFPRGTMCIINPRHIYIVQVLKIFPIMTMCIIKHYHCCEN